MTRIILTCLVMMTIASSALAQRQMRRPGNFNAARNHAMAYLEKQWWLGFKTGVTLSEAVPESRYHVIAPVNYDADAIEKRYTDFRTPGFQATFELAFTFRSWSASLQPAYRTTSFVYNNDYYWGDGEDARYSLKLSSKQQNRLSYFDVPLTVRYEFPISLIRPYLHAGVYTSRLIDAHKEVTVRGVDHASGGENHFTQEPVAVGARDLFASYHWGLAGGAGVSYNLGNVRLNLDITCKKGMSNIVMPSKRYGNDRLSGVADALDDARLNTITVSFGCLFPLKFLQSGFKSIPD